MPRNRIIPYNPKLKTLARELRRNSTLAEVLLWERLKNRALGVQFHRQVPLDEYIVDFYCHEHQLAIEIDGVSHEGAKAFKADAERQVALEKLGVSFLRFDDRDVKCDIENVVRGIEGWLHHQNNDCQ